jgi:hypothetical protein
LLLVCVHFLQAVVCRPGLTFRRVMLNSHIPQALAFRDLIVRGALFTLMWVLAYVSVFETD